MSRTSGRPRGRTLTRGERLRAWLAGPLIVVGAVMAWVPGGGDPPIVSAAPVAGSQGTDTALPGTPSQVTVRGRGDFADLEITVNQTRDLSNQAVSITWRGAEPTTPGPGDWGANFLQVMQCWGSDDGSVAGNPGPPPEQCQFGAGAGSPTFPGGSVYPNGFSMSRVITRRILPNFDPNVGVLDRETGEVWRPFRAVDGTVITSHYDPDFNPQIQGGNFWLNPFFNIVTTNEIYAARTGPDGRGSELFQVNTGLEAPGLGCGQRTQPATGGARQVPQCWLVIVPRGGPVTENAGLIEVDDNPATPDVDEQEVVSVQRGVISSPLSPEAWRNRIAIPLEFRPVDSPCDINAESRRIVGSELLQLAVSSWQPSLCSGTGLPPYSYAAIGDISARQQLASNASGAAGFAVVSRPVTGVSESSPVVYAPLSVAGVVIGFNIERVPSIDAPEEARLIAGVRVAQIDLTPRLVAKLLTQSYRTQVEVGGSRPGYAWATNNPRALGEDEDFLRFNPEFELLQASGRLLGGLQLPAGGSDAALQMWEWILADPEASAWLAGTPDEWGMRVNPAYSTNASTNPSGTPFGDPLPTSFPKADPYCYQPPSPNGVLVPPRLCGTDWMPYGRNMAETAAWTRSGNDTARIVPNPLAGSATEYWRRDVPQAAGSRAMIAVSDTANAARFGLQAARLSRAGDNGTTRRFIAPDADGLAAGVAAMTPASGTNVLVPAQRADAPAAYPLTMVTYGAIRPLSLDTRARSDYASFVEYATGPGQVAGTSIGQLPRGYLPLPTQLRSQALSAIEQIRTLTPPPTTTVDVAGPTTSTTVAAASAGPSSPSIGPSGGFPTGGTSSSGAGRPSGSGGAAPTTGTTPESVPPSTEEVPESTEPDTEEAPPTSAVAAPVDDSATTTTIATTPGLDLGRGRFAVAGIGAVALGAALGALELTKRTRRATGTPAGEGLGMKGLADA